MINNIIKMFYSDVVKTKMGSMTNNEYELRPGCEKIIARLLKIENYILKTIKFILICFALYLTFKSSILLGFGLVLISTIYYTYKLRYKEKVKMFIEDKKNNSKEFINRFINEKGKIGINLLITLMIITIFTGFNYFIGVSFIIVSIYTIGNIYQSFKL